MLPGRERRPLAGENRNELDAYAVRDSPTVHGRARAAVGHGYGEAEHLLQGCLIAEGAATGNQAPLPHRAKRLRILCSDGRRHDRGRGRLHRPGDARPGARAPGADARRRRVGLARRRERCRTRPATRACRDAVVRHERGGARDPGRRHHPLPFPRGRRRPRRTRRGHRRRPFGRAPAPRPGRVRALVRLRPRETREPRRVGLRVDRSSSPRPAVWSPTPAATPLRPSSRSARSRTRSTRSRSSSTGSPG